MKLYKQYTKEPNSYIVSNMTLSSDNPLRFRKNLLYMSISEKIKTINNKIEENKAQHNSDRKTAKKNSFIIMKC